MTDSQETVETLVATGSGTEVTSRKDNNCSHPGKEIVVVSGSCKINICLLCCVGKDQIYNGDGGIPISLKQLRKKLTAQHERSEKDEDSQHLESHDTAPALQEPTVVTRGRAHVNRVAGLAKKHWSSVDNYIRQRELGLPLLSLFAVVISALLLMQLSGYDQCSSNPCRHGGTCKVEGSITTCLCADTHTGEFCEIDIDKCSPNPCKHGGTCEDKLGTVSCTCTKGFCGEICDFEINECSSNPCQNGGTCLDGVGSFSCSCPKGVTGRTCNEETDECSSNPCQYGGTCTDGLGSFSCTCPEGLTGEICTEDIDECSSNPCQFGGTCRDRLASFTCSCPEGFTGETCNVAPLTGPGSERFFVTGARVVRGPDWPAGHDGQDAHGPGKVTQVVKYAGGLQVWVTWEKTRLRGYAYNVRVDGQYQLKLLHAPTP